MFGALGTGWAYAPKPRGLPVWLLVIGLQLLVFGGLRAAFRTHPLLDTDSTHARLGLVVLGMGYLFAALSVIRTNYGAYAAFLFVLFRGLEGAAVIRFYRKVVFAFRNRRTPNGANATAFVTYHLLVFFLAVVGFGLLLAGLAPATAAEAGVSVADPRLLYTAVTFSLSMLGVYWRLTPTGDTVDWIVVVGFGLSIAGAELFNYASLGTEVALTLVGIAAYSAGFWLLVACWQLGVVPTTQNGS